MGGPARLRLLLDTHIWLWLLSDPRKLGRRTLQELKNENNELWVSPISTWEVLTLNFKGRIRLVGDLREWLSRATAGPDFGHSRRAAFGATKRPVPCEPVVTLPEFPCERRRIHHRGHRGRREKNDG